MTNRTRVAVGWLLLLVLGVIVYVTKTKEGQTVINVDGFEVEYRSSNRDLSVEQFGDLDLGSSMKDIEANLGQADTWVGGGITRPVYFLREDQIVVLYFTNPLACEDLKEIVVYNVNGEKNVIKIKE